MRSILGRSRGLLCLLLHMQIGFEAVAAETFTAVAKHPLLRRRNPDFAPSLQEQTLFYGGGADIGSSHAAKISLQPNAPMLLLEDIQDHVKNIECQNEQVLILFHDDTSMQSAHTTWVASGEFLVVASHFGCATRGEHAVFVTSHVSMNAAALLIILSVTPTTFKSCSSHMLLDLGNHIIPEVSPSILPRDTIVPSTTSNYQTGTLTPSVSISFSTPATLPTAQSIAYSFESFTHIGNTIVPPPSSILQYLPPAYSPPADVILKCLNCTLVGSIDLKAVNLNLSSADSSTYDDLEATAHFFKEGWLEFEANNMAANMSFELDFMPGFTAQYVAELPDIPLGGIDIRGIVELGLILKPTFPIGITLESSVQLRSGFLLDVPQNSQIILNVSDINLSYVTGFQNTKITPLPFSAEAKNLSMTLFAGFQPHLVLTAMANTTRFDDEIGVSGGVGVFVDLPKLSAEVEMLHNVSSTCQGRAPDGQTNTYIHVKPSAAFSFNSEWNLGLTLPLSFLDYSAGNAQDLDDMTVSLDNYDQCLLWDSKTHGTVPQSSNANGSAKNSGSAKTAALHIDSWVIALVLLLGFTIAWL